MNRLALCTVATRSHLPFARVLVRSFRACHPQGKAFVLLLDAADDSAEAAGDEFEVVRLTDLSIPDLRRFCFQYTPLELSCATKSWFVAHLLEHRDVSRLVYLDADTLVTRRLRELEEVLERASIVVNPHFARPFDDDARKPGEAEILAAGMYNAGFFAVANDRPARECMAWLAERVYDQCLEDVSRGLFVDQRWLDFLPGMFDRVHILRHPAYNLGYWSLPYRSLSSDLGELRVDGEPLAIFHFSGLDLEHLEGISRYQNRFTLTDLEPLRPLFESYRDRVVAAGSREARELPYGFGRFSNGVRILPEMRRMYWQLGDRVATFGDPFATESPTSFWHWMHGDVPPGSGVSRFWHHIHSTRPDLQQVMPDLFGAHRRDFLSWIQHDGRREYDLGPEAPRPSPARGSIATPAVAAAPTPVIPGVNLAGNVRSEKGVGEALRANARALTAAGIPHVVIDFPDGGSRNEEPALLDVLDHNPHEVNLIQVNANALPYFVASRGRSFLKGRYNIGYWLWELPELPRVFHASFSYLDEVWVASSYCQEAISKDSPVPVVKIPLSIAPESRSAPQWGRERFGLREGPMVFLFTFDAESVVERKNPLGLIRAFRAAFKNVGDVRLVLKLARGGEGVRRSLREASGNDDRLVLIDTVLDRSEIHSLIAACDCYVSLHRAEGFGLTIAEAMALGKPVIATSYSGNADFMTPTNSLQVGYELIELERDFGPYPRGSRWADPDLRQASEFMRSTYENREWARSIGERAARDIWDYLSPASIGRRIAARLEAIAPRLRHRVNANLFGRSY